MFTLQKFKNFFEYYKGEPHQDRGIEILFNSMPSHLLRDSCDWVQQFRTPLEEKSEIKSKPAWPLTKMELGEIMLCDPDQLPDSLMDDLAECVNIFGMTPVSLAYFLGQCGHESAGLRYPVEIHSGTDYEWRSDLGNRWPGDGVKFAGTGWIQVTGRYNHQRFADYLEKLGKNDYRIMEEGKTYTSEKYPWSISGFWWDDNGMNDFCESWPDVDKVGARVNGKYLPNGHLDRREYTNRAFEVLGL